MGKILIVVQLIFIGLKCFGVIPWCWAAVLTPLWIYLGILTICCFTLWWGEIQDKLNDWFNN